MISDRPRWAIPPGSARRTGPAATAVAALSDSTPGAIGTRRRPGCSRRRRRQARPLEPRHQAEAVGPVLRVDRRAVEARAGSTVSASFASSSIDGPSRSGTWNADGPGGPGRLRVERVGGLAEQDDARPRRRPPPSGGRPRRSPGPGTGRRACSRRARGRRATRPGSRGRSPAGAGRRSPRRRARDAAPGRAGARSPTRSIAAGGGSPDGPVSHASTRSGKRSRTSATIRAPAIRARPCLRMPRPASRSRARRNVGFEALETSLTGPANARPARGLGRLIGQGGDDHRRRRAARRRPADARGRSPGSRRRGRRSAGRRRPAARGPRRSRGRSRAPSSGASGRRSAGRRRPAPGSRGSAQRPG